MELEKNTSVKLSDKLHESLMELIRLHRQLYDVVKNENEAISNADSRATYEATAAKEALIHLIHQSEMNRQSVVHAIAFEYNLSNQNPTLKELIIHFETESFETSTRLQADLNMLIVLVERIKKQNEVNGRLVAESLKHINNMKKNIFGETSNKAGTYNQSGRQNAGSVNEHGPRLISREV
jgi:flagellar biosynthesis/type III secretory pathway chaperone